MACFRLTLVQDIYLFSFFLKIQIQIQMWRIEPRSLKFWLSEFKFDDHYMSKEM